MRRMRFKHKKGWWKDFFGKDYIEEWRTSEMFEHTKKEINFLERVIPLRKNDEILDLCCGHGRHTIELARRGYNVVGLDFNPYAVNLARETAEQKGVRVTFVKGDARKFNFHKKFDVIINMFTAFGYGSKEDDRKIVQNVNRALKKNGKFFIDLQSLPWLWRHFSAIKRQKIGRTLLVSRRHYDFLNGTINDTRTVYKGGKKRIMTTHVRSYTLAELNNLLEQEGFKVIGAFGSYDRRPFGLDARRMLVLAKKV